MSTVEITIRNRLDDLARVRELVATLAATHDLPSGTVFDMNVALDEVLSNIVKYGYQDDDVHEIRVALTAAKDVIVAEIEDDGRPFNPAEAVGPDTSAPLAERTVGGLGVHFVKGLMDEVRYSRIGTSNRLVLRKSFSSHDGENSAGSE